MLDDALTFIDEDDLSPTDTSSPWHILIVDDDDDVHSVTKLALHNVIVSERPLHFTSAYSAQEAKKLLAKNQNFELIFLDVVMENDQAGLEVVEFIRKELLNDRVRIIIRTGEPGSAPERMIIDSYDINDYKEKTELNVTKLYTTLRSSLLQYEQIDKLYKQQKNLERIIEKKVTESKLQQEALFETNRYAQMGELLNMIAHQWRQPLARIGAVMGHIQVGISLENLSNEDIVPLVSSAESYLQNLSKIINDFQKLYDNEKNKRDLPTDIMINDAITILKDSYSDANIRLIYKPDSVVVKLYSIALKQVFTNILKNAYDEILKENIEEGCIEIRTNIDDNVLCIEIEDNAGKGEDLDDKIFEPYVSASMNKNGKGLGLYISKMIVQMHCSGMISVRNGSKGACFMVRLPLVEDENVED